MTATNEQIIAEAGRRWELGRDKPVTHYVIEVTREGWKPPPPVDPDVLAYRKWLNGPFRVVPTLEAAYLAGARMAREQEQERAKELVAFVEPQRPYDKRARTALAKYWGEAR
jgi:hypothetical protein